ncbi:MAG: sensor histidine kinase [Anaerolineae bacterium]
MKFNLGVKLLISYLVIVMTGVFALSLTASIFAPAALDRHIAEMQSMGQSAALVADLHRNFRAAVNAILVISTSVAMLAAGAVSAFVTRRILDPIRQMKTASRLIAEGDYQQRVKVYEEDELGELARTFNQMAERLAHTEERRMELIGNVAHELRTPLSSVGVLMEGLVDGVLPQEPATYISVQREVARLQRLVDDLQELSRAEAGQLHLDLQPVNPIVLVERTADKLRPQFADKSVSLVLHLPERTPQLDLDPDRFTQILINIMGNALQYTPEGGRVTVTADTQAGAFRLRIADTGIGLRLADQQAIFERFYRVEKSRARTGGGSGVGLTIARYLVEMHGGHIHAESAGLGHGSTFVVSLPLT